ncbi:hypothetical protein COLU111180_09115 [Cohnella lubricantis]|nr:hypothetical protein [Cohnella lubricantis]
MNKMVSSNAIDMKLCKMSSHMIGTSLQESAHSQLNAHYSSIIDS